MTQQAVHLPLEYDAVPEAAIAAASSHKPFVAVACIVILVFTLFDELLACGQWIASSCGGGFSLLCSALIGVVSFIKSSYGMFGSWTEHVAVAPCKPTTTNLDVLNSSACPEGYYIGLEGGCEAAIDHKEVTDLTHDDNRNLTVHAGPETSPLVGHSDGLLGLDGFRAVGPPCSSDAVVPEAAEIITPHKNQLDYKKKKKKKKRACKVPQETRDIRDLLIKQGAQITNAQVQSMLDGSYDGGVSFDESIDQDLSTTTLVRTGQSLTRQELEDSALGSDLQEPESAFDPPGYPEELDFEKLKIVFGRQCACQYNNQTFDTDADTLESGARILALIIACSDKCHIGVRGLLHRLFVGGLQFVNLEDREWLFISALSFLEWERKQALHHLHVGQTQLAQGFNSEPDDSLTPPPREFGICSDCGGLVRDGVTLLDGQIGSSGGCLHERIPAFILPAILQEEDWCQC